jgi:hypothetical protein
MSRAPRYLKTMTHYTIWALRQQGSCDVQNPWPALLQYQEADGEFFHGREAETDELLRLVMRARLSLLFGLSGLGKSWPLAGRLVPLPPARGEHSAGLPPS